MLKISIYTNTPWDIELLSELTTVIVVGFICWFSQEIFHWMNSNILWSFGHMWSWINNFFLFNAEWKWKSSCFVLRIVCPICSKVAYQSAVVCFKGGWTSMYGSLLSYPSILRSRPWGQLKSPHPPSPRGSPTQMPSAPSTRNLLSKYPQAGWHNLLPRRDEDQLNFFEDVA